jgi:hypothetical protein
MRQWHLRCNLHSWSELVRPYRCLSVVAIVLLVTLCALFSLSTHTATEPIGNRSPQAKAVTLPSADSDPPDESEGTIDLFGNDVTDAVARYRMDATGSLYEVHSPQTEIPKLAPPKS